MIQKYIITTRFGKEEIDRPFKNNMIWQRADKIYYDRSLIVDRYRG